MELDSVFRCRFSMVSSLCIAYSVSHAVSHDHFSSQLSHQRYVGGAGGRDMHAKCSHVYVCEEG